MLSNRLGNNGGVNPIPDAVPEPSAAGTLRRMTAQHNASLNQAVPPPHTAQEMMALQQQQQRRSLSNITNPVVAPPVPQQGVVVPQGPGSVMTPQSPNQIRGNMFSPNRMALPRPQFYGHNPNLKLPSELFLIGCHFHIASDLERDDPEEVPRVRAIIEKYGGEVEVEYNNQRVTHVLCRTQRDGIVMQALRDSKRCITTWWLKDCLDKRVLQPPWQALHLPYPHFFDGRKPARQHIICATGFESPDRKRIMQMVLESGARLTSYFSRQHTLLIAKKNDMLNPKIKKAKEWNIPIVNVVWLNDILMGKMDQHTQYDAPRYQQYNLTCQLKIDYPLVSQLLNPWKSPINLTLEANERLKRALSEPPQPPKSPKKPRLSPFYEQVPEQITCTKHPDPDKIPKVQFSGVENIEGLTRAIR